MERQPGPCLSLAAAFSIVFAFLWFGCAEKRPQDGPSQKRGETLEDVIPLTAANIRGHQMLYNEGWFVISSSRNALQYAKAKSVVASGQAIREAQERVVARSVEYKQRIGTD